MTTTTSYDELPYDSQPFNSTHPDALATMATLFGLEPPPIESCRVLELGCASGGNLVPMALGLPEARFVGVDLSSRQIASGQQLVDRLGLTNLSLMPLSILDVDASFGTFDFIICHGVYSWVPPQVQDKILDICKKQLAPHGVAYVSYNTYPGWHVRGMIREMMRYHEARRLRADGEPTPAGRIQEARAFLDFLVESVPNPNTTHGLNLREEALLLGRSADSYLLHEQLEEVNEPLYFHQFADRAAAKGLQYLGEARFSDVESRLSAAARAKLADWSSDRIEFEQYLDFLRDQTFRRTLLCRAEHRLRAPNDPEVCTRLFFASRLGPTSSPAPLETDDEVEFTAPGAPSLSTNNPVLKTALRVLWGNWPRPLHFRALWDEVRDRLKASESREAVRQPTALAGPLLSCAVSGLVDPHVHSPSMVTEAGDRPLASPLARVQALDQARITNLWHAIVELDDALRFMLVRLDGTRDRSALAELMREAFANGSLSVSLLASDCPNGPPALDDLHRALDVGLGKLADAALLLA